MDPENKNKYEFLCKLLSEGDAMVCLDARHPGVSVPKHLADNPMLNLVFNLGFKRPLNVEEDGIYATLAFNGRPHKCVIPFESVWAIYVPSTQHGQVWEASIPGDLDLEGRIARSKQSGTQAPAEAPKPAEAQAPAPKAPEPKPDKPKRDRSHLRVIK